MGVHSRAGAFAGQRPLGVGGAEVIHHIRLKAAVDKAQVHNHRRASVLSGVREIHHPLQVTQTDRLAVGDILGSDVIPPGPDGPVYTVLLHIHPRGEQFGPGGYNAFSQIGLALHNKAGAGLQPGILPGLRQPGVNEVLQLFRIVLAGKELPRHIRKTDEGGVKGVNPEPQLPSVRAVLLDRTPLPQPQHLSLVLVGDDTFAFRADIMGRLCPVGVR